ncbi:MAG: MBL fold metallo-hydrolase [Holosporales bacterium]|jgi:phosphoribosyl 1,2-cyclic phosphate phosphodiesterase|nr:MBL fold metallo-hydrolase [Holosporales bacterium]
MRFKATILGCGPSGGVPCPGLGWGDCDPNNPKNYRLRSSLLIETPETTLLIDTSPDLRQQLLTHDVKKIDAVLYTHGHADHTDGINDLRPFAFLRGAPIPIYATPPVLSELKRRFSHIFDGFTERLDLYPPFLQGNTLLVSSFRIRDIVGRAMEQDHYTCSSLGFRFGDLAYSTDVCRFPEETLQALAGIKTWIVECGDPHETPSHSSLQSVLRWAERIRPKRAILVHMKHTMDYATLCRTLPQGIEPAYDGLSVEGNL